MLSVCRRYLKRQEDAEEALLVGFAKMSPSASSTTSWPG